MKRSIVITGLLFLFIAIISLNSYSQNQFIGKWEGSMTCVDPNRAPQDFKLDVWVDNGVIRCSDHSASNVFDPCWIQNGQLYCRWKRSNSNANGTYVFQLVPGNPNALTGYENAANTNCRKYTYKLNRINPPAMINKSSFIGEWEGDTWCANPSGSKSGFKFTIWSENGVLKCSDHSSSNKFHPCRIENGNRIICNWYRTNSDKKGTYVFYFENNNPSVLLGYENTHGISCKQYSYRLNRKK